MPANLRTGTPSPAVLPFFLLAACGGSELPTATPPAVEPQMSVSAAVSELYFSEYIEGTSNNKALEIYNGTGLAVDLTANGYNVQMYFNGSASAGLTINLSGVVGPGDVFVLAQSSAGAAILAQADQTNGAGWFNGDDAVVLRKGTTVLDVIGQIGLDPGSEWGSGLTSTADNTLRRLPAVCQGDPDGTNAFDPAAEWDGYATDTFTGLGSHGASCGEAAPAVAATTPADGATGVSLDADLTLTFTEPVDVAGTWYAIACTTSGTHAATASGGPTTWTLDPDADFAAGENCTVTVFASGVTDQDANDPPDTMAADFTWSFTTFAVNPCVAAFTPAYSVQGSGATTPLDQQILTTQGVVVGDFEGPAPALRGFYLQDAVGDGDAATSDAVFVFNGNADAVNLGDVVRVTGRAEEFQGQTQIGAVSSVTVCASGAAVPPADLTLPFPSPTYPERFEGMLVRLPQTLYVTEHFQLGRFGQVVMSSGARLPQPTGIAMPGAAALAVQAANDLNRILIDDGRNDQNPDPILFGGAGSPLTAANPLRGGDAATGIVGVLTYGWAGNSASGNAYRVRPVNALGGGVPTFIPANPRPLAPAVGGSVRVATLNLLNYFNTFGAGCASGVGGTPTACRGASNAAEFDRQWPKTVAAILATDADVLGAIEIENDGYGPASAIADLVDRLNATAGSGTWAFIDVDALTGQVNALGVDAIRVGLLYRPSRVTPVGTTAVLNSPAFVNGGDSEIRNRPALAQAFERPDRARFIVSVNHFKSKGNTCDIPDAGDGQGECNVVRTNAASLLLSWLATDPTRTADRDVLIMGDLNAYAMEDPVRTLTGGGFVNLVASHIGTGGYSFGFDGQWGYLDHALASANLAPQVAGVAEWHINADEPAVLDYNVEFKSPAQQLSLYAPDAFRSGDHDPVIVGLNPYAPPVTWDFGGFLPPVAGEPAENVAKAGRAVPVKFSLGGGRGLGIFEAGYPKSVPVTCGQASVSGSIEETVTAGQSALSYDAATDTYTYVWQTEAGWADSCRELVIRLTDETVHRALFRFRR